MNFLNEVVSRYPDAISFAPGRPSEALFSVERALAARERFVRHQAEARGVTEERMLASLGQYGRTKGLIHEQIAAQLALDEDIRVAPESIVVTNGCQEAMSILLAGLFDPARDVLLTVDPTYIGITGMATILGVPLMPVRSDERGITIPGVERAIAETRRAGKRPRACYVIPDFNNPLGTSLDVETRSRLLELAAAEGMLLFEDNPYGMFSYDEAPAPTLKSLDREGVVVYLGTFSKTLFPGLRVGYLVADQTVEPRGGLLADELSKVKSLNTVNTSPLMQAVVGGLLLEHGGSLREIVAQKLDLYRANRDRMLGRLEEVFGAPGEVPDAVRWNRPGGGFFLTVDLPFAFDDDCVHRCAHCYGVVCCPMSLFSLAGGREAQIRLSFSYVTPEEIDEGVERLGRFVRDHCGGATWTRGEPRTMGRVS